MLENLSVSKSYIAILNFFRKPGQLNSQYIYKGVFCQTLHHARIIILHNVRAPALEEYASAEFNQLPGVVFVQAHICGYCD